MDLSSSQRFARLPALATAAIAITLAGCGNLTMGGFGSATVIVSGDAPDLNQSLSVVGTPSGLAPSSPATASGSSSNDPEGQIEVDFLLYLVSETGAATRLGEEVEVRLDLRGDTEADAIEQQVPVARYTSLQIVFTDIRVQVDAGLIINGVPVTGEIRIEYDDVTLLVEKTIDVDVSEGGAVELVIDLNAPAWLEAVDPTTATVDASVFADLLAVGTR